MEFEDRYMQVQRPKYDCLLFGVFLNLENMFFAVDFEPNLTKLFCTCLDLDDTLYPLSSGLAASVLKNIQGKLVFAVEHSC